MLHSALVASLVLAGSMFALDERPGAVADATLSSEVKTAMRRAATYYRSKVASHGGYVYHYRLDLAQRWGEGEAGVDQVWVQPPGTPTVALAYLRAYDATGDRFYLDAAREAAEALRYGQLASGGWTNVIDFASDGAKRARYRNGRGRARGPNNSTLDDGISQAAIQFLLQMDRALGGKDQGIHESLQIACEALLKAQFPNGGFPQVWTGPVPQRPIVKAAYPDYDWRTEGRVKNYWDMYTLNDGLAGTVTQTLLNVFEVTKDRRYKEALQRLGDFLVLAQMPDPQPAWAQQYDEAMHPIWARRFEPAAVTGGESQDVLETLMTIARVTGDPKYLAPIPKALAYLKRSVLADGRLARYYELKTNRPLYMTRRGDEYTLSYDDSDLPSHYGWKVESRLAAIEARYRALKAGGEEPRTKLAADDDLADLEGRVRRIVRDLDDQGRWISRYRGESLVGQPKFLPGMGYLSSKVFSDNLEALSSYLIATSSRSGAGTGPVPR